MLWVGGGIIIHGLEEYGLGALGHAVEGAAEAVGHALPAAVAGFGAWLVTAAAGGLFGLALGAALIPVVKRVATPAMAWLRPGAASTHP